MRDGDLNKGRQRRGRGSNRSQIGSSKETQSCLSERDRNCLRDKAAPPLLELNSCHINNRSRNLSYKSWSVRSGKRLWLSRGDGGQKRLTAGGMKGEVERR